MRIRTIPKTVKEIRLVDPSSAIGESFLTALAESKQLPHTYHGNRRVTDADAIVSTLNRLFGLDGSGTLPHVRSIREAAAELKKRDVNIGVGEKLIRSAVKDGRIPSIRVGNREYIAMQSFDEPYCRRIFEPTIPAPVSRAEAVRRDVMEQMAQTIASSPYVPTVTRLRRAR
ncbi:MAG: hypothetical protein IJD75_02185 [Clostridia bacterium]|nr:hypothetical protein [Clostridia bacterium]